MKKQFILTTIFLTLFSFTGKTYSALLENENNNIQVYKDAVPSVVNVTNIKIAGNMFYGNIEVPAGMGTGFVWDKDGHIVTNYHVVQDGTKFIISFFGDKKQYHAKLVGSEARKDVAVLKLEEMPSTLKPVNLGDSGSLQVGQNAIAIGNPFELNHSMSTGIISALDRQIEGIGGVKIHNMIQTDAAINMGNSGGPLLDSSSKVIGMNTQIVSTSGSSAGLGFAVPIDTIKRVVPQLIAHGKIIQPGLGIGILPEGHRRHYFDLTKGVVITYIDENGAAFKSGLQGMKRDNWGRTYLGDVIIAIDGKEVNSLDDTYHLLSNYKVGDKVTVKFLRNNKVMETKVTLGSI